MQQQHNTPASAESMTANDTDPEWPTNLATRHRNKLIGSAVSPAVAVGRGYSSAEEAAQIRRFGFRRRDLDPRGLLIPLHDVRGNRAAVQFRPDEPPVTEQGKIRKYLLPPGTKNLLDVHPHTVPVIDDPTVPLHLTEGALKVDAIVSAGGHAIGLIGVHSFVGRNTKGGKTVLADFDRVAWNDRDVFISFDSDVASNPNVADAARKLAAILRRLGAQVRYVMLPNGPGGEKWGVDDFLAAGHTLSDVEGLAQDEAPYANGDGDPMLTETDVARLHVARHGEELRYCPERGRWLRWDETRWRWDIAEEHRERAKDVAASLPHNGKEERAFRRRMLSGAGISAIGRLAQSDPRVVVLIDELDSDPFQLNTPAGVVDLRTGAVEPHSPERWFTKQTAHGVSDEECPQFDAFMSTTFGANGDLIAYVQRLLGYSLVGAVIDHVLPFCYGIGANGKSVLLDVAMGLLGIGEDGYAIAAPATFLMSRAYEEHQTEIARLRGARLVVCQEVGRDHSFDEPKLKQLTGGDRLAGRFMRRDYFTFSPTHHLWIAGNHQPTVAEGGPAFWRRLRLIPFDHVVPVEDRNPYLAADLLAKEGPAILMWMVRGAVEMLARGLAEPESVRTATDNYAKGEDSVGQFVDVMCDLRPRDVSPNAAGWITKGSIIRDNYGRWCEHQGLRAVDAKTLTQRLARHGVTVQSKRDANYYDGVRPKPEGS